MNKNRLLIAFAIVMQLISISLSAVAESIATAELPVSDDSYGDKNFFRTALIMARDMTIFTDLHGKFAGYDSIDAIASRTNAQDNFHWEEFASVRRDSKLDSYGYRTPLGDFVTVNVVTANQKKIGLVVNLTNQKTAFYPIGASTITPAGDELASALAVLLEFESKVNDVLATRNISPDVQYAYTIESLEYGLGDTEAKQAASTTVKDFPSYVIKTWSYKPFLILSTPLGLQMSDSYIANTFLCKTPTETLQATMDLLRNYDLTGTSKTDGALTTTSFKGIQQGGNVTVSLAVDEQSNPRIVRYILVDGAPALSCQ